MNSVHLSGNLTRSPEFRQTQGGTQILTFGIAVNDRKKDQQSGEWVDVPNFFDVCLFGRRAESLSKILDKGMRVVIGGRLRWSQFNDKQGQKRSKVEIIADEVVLMSQPKPAQGQQQPQTNNYTQQTQNTPNMAPQRPTGGYSDVYEGSDIPF